MSEIIKETIKSLVGKSTKIMIKGNPKPYYGIVKSADETHFSFIGERDGKPFAWEYDEVKNVG